MAFIKFIAKLALTLLIAIQLFVLVTQQKTGTSIADQAIASAAGIDLSPPSAASDDEAMLANAPVYPYVKAKRVTDYKSLEAMAKIEAERMIRTGDTSAYERALNQSSLMKKIMNGEISSDQLK